jgi:hypothetical protein
MKLLNTADAIKEMSSSIEAALNIAVKFSENEVNDYEKETSTFEFSDNSVLMFTTTDFNSYFNIDAISAVSNAEKSQEQIDYELTAMFN